MRTKAFVFFTLIFCLFKTAFAQLPPQLFNVNYGYMQPMHNTGVAVSLSLAPFGDLTSDGAGHHYVVPNSSGQIVHYLFDNVGTPIQSSTFGSDASRPCITARNGLVHVVLHNTNLNRIELYESADGGSNWDSPAFQLVQGALNGIDAFEDFRGVHITYSSSSGIYYHMRDVVQGAWADYAPTVYGPSAPDAQPAITASPFTQQDSVHVLSAYGFHSFKFPSSGNGSWVPSTSPWANPTRSAFVVVQSRRPFTGPLVPFAFAIGRPSADTRFYRGFREYDIQESWTTFSLWDNGHFTSDRVSVTTMTGYPDDITWPYFVYPDYEAFGDRIFMHRLLPANEIVPSSFGFVDVTFVPPNVWRYGKGGVIGANQGTVAVIWRTDAQGTLYFRRKPHAIIGNMNENYVLTDTNWVLSTTTLAANKELRLKSGSITYLSGEFSYGGEIRGPGKFVISGGASLVIESGAKLILQSPTGTFSQGGMIECGDGVTVTVQGVLEANAGTKLVFGSNSSLVVNTRFDALGTATKPVVLTRIGTSGTWDGIVIDNCASATPCALSYANISHCGTGISTRVTANVNMDHCLFDHVDIGVEIVPNEGDCPTSGYAKQIVSSTFTNIASTGILVNSFSNLTIQGNTIRPASSSSYAIPAGITCIASSPKILNNNIQEFTIGLQCLSASAPVLEDNLLGGFNIIKKNGIGVLCQDGSNAVLGFLSPNWNDQGGMNSITGNYSFDVSLINDCTVYAENNWWGLTTDPPGAFEVDGSSKLYYSPWLTSDPNGDSPANGRGSGDPIMSPMPAIARRALTEMADSHYPEAIQLLRTIVSNSTLESFVRQWAIRMLLVVSQYQSGSNLSAYLQAGLATHPTLARGIRSVLPYSYINERTSGNALASFDANLTRYPGSELARGALYGKFINELYSNNDLSNASRLCEQLENDFPSSVEASLARIQLQNNHPPQAHTSPLGNGLSKKSDGPDGSREIPGEFRLGQNYPNPFNPVATIKYGLPVDAHISLKVYDVLGREVATLVNEFLQAGYHHATLNASSLASGMYFYRMQAGEFTSVKKLLLLK